MMITRANMLNQLVVTLSKPSLLILLLFIITTLQPSPASAQPPTKPTYFIELCQTTFGNYPANGTYAKHLNATLSDLKTNSSIHFSYNTTTVPGRNKRQVFGQYYCRGDIGRELCRDCIGQAAEIIQRNCSHSRAAIIWFEECTLQYGNGSMAPLEAEYPRSWLFSDANVTDTAKFGDVLNTTIDRIINESAFVNGSLHFATGEGVVSALETAYCLVQCIPSLNGTQCETCLKSAYGFVPNCCGTSAKSVFVFFPSCQLRYSTEGPFYALLNGSSTQQGPSLAPTVQPPPPAVVVNAGNSKAVESCRDSMKLGLLVAALAFLMLWPTM